MCGIIGSNFCRVDAKVLKHRGPDNLGTFNYKNISLAHSRLSIIDLSKEANQPMEFDDIVIVFNGEIYNYSELKIEHNLKCKTKSDTEVLIRLYQKYSFNFLNYLNGMFSFCIYDKTKNILFCARDRYGQKPFYYYKKGNFLFASEIKGILKYLNSLPEINYIALYQYLSFMSPIDKNTFYKDIYKLPAGHYLLFNISTTNLDVYKYYDLPVLPLNEFSNEDEVIEKLEILILDSIKLRLISDVEVASLLSGGLDSSLITLLYSKLYNYKINTFSIGYNEYLHYSELEFAKKVPKVINSNHNEIIINKNDFLETIEKMINYLDEPLADSAAIPTFILSKYIRNKGIKVALTGEGSDENFLGYDNYLKVLTYYKVNNKKQYKYEPFNRENKYLFRASNKLEIFKSTAEVFTEEDKKVLLKRDYKAEDYLSKYYLHITPIKWFMYIDYKIWIAEVLMTKLDRMSMANSVELRSPFLDFRLVDFAFSINDSLKLGDTNKYLLKKIAHKYLPNEIINRKKKGFSSPFIEWLYKDSILLEIININKQLNIFNNNTIKELYEKGRKREYKQYVWSLYILAKWFNKVYL